MKTRCAFALGLLGWFLGSPAGAQPPGGPGGFGPPGGMPFGPPGGQERKLVKQFDADGDGRLNAEERKAAREEAQKGPGGPRFGPPGGFGRKQDPPKPGAKVDPKDAPAYPDAPLYEPTALRTLFLRFENPDWEAELQDFYNTDVEVPCLLTVDGKTYRDVGVHFRGMSSYFTVSAGLKRSLNLSLDYADKAQRLYGAKTLNLLNSHEDASFLSTVLYSHIARQYIPAPKANLVKVVVNGESWGVYANAQQFDKEFVAENFKSAKGARWKVRGSPGGGGGLEYLGDDVEQYKRRYELKSGDEKAWRALVNFCKVLNQTPPDKLEAALRPVCDVDGLLWFLALDTALVNCDGYWIRASDYAIYLDDKGKFHFVPHDMNEAFRPPGGPGFGGPPGGMTAFTLPRPGEVLPGPLQDQLKLSGEQKMQLGELQKDVDGRLEKILSDDQRTQLRELRDRPPGGGMMMFGGPPGGGPARFPGGGPPDGGPGGFPGGGPPGGGPGGFPGQGPGGGPGGGGRRGGPGGMATAGGTVDLDPLVGLDDTGKPLRSKVLAVPALRAQYLKNVKTIAEKSLDWKALGPVVAQYRKLIEKEVEADTRKLEPFEAFQRMTADDATAGRGREFPLRAFADGRRKYLLAYQEPKPGVEQPK